MRLKARLNSRAIVYLFRHLKCPSIANIIVLWYNLNISSLLQGEKNE